MPPKMKLHNKNGKMKSFPTKEIPPQPGPSTEEQNPSEHQAQFELELCWCIQRLELSLEDKKINQKQAQEIIQILKVLKSKSQHTVRKRQLMRMHFGDYRAQMAKEEKNAKKEKEISFSCPGNSNEKSMYIRKSFALSTGDNSFRFNFPPNSSDNNQRKSEESGVSERISKMEITEEIPLPQSSAVDVNSTNRLQFSSQEFKFNFNIDGRNE